MNCSVKWACLLLVIFSAGSLAAPPAVSYRGHSKIQVEDLTAQQLETIEALGVRILNCHIGHGPLQAIASSEQLAELQRMGIQYAVHIADIGAAMEEQSQENAGRVAALAMGDPFSDFFLDYRDYTATSGGIIWYMNELVARYPGLAEMVVVGTTLQGQTIHGIKVTNLSTTDKPGVVYFGAEHAREWITTTVATYFANHLLSNYGVDSQITELVDNVEFYLIPVFNVDGYNYTRTSDRFWRKNRRNNGNGTFGVDINRNWGTGWGGQGSSGAGNSETYRGTAAFSEPETQSMRDFFIAHPNVRAQLDIHSYSQLILWPYAYTNALPPDQDIYSEVGFGMENLIESVYGTQFRSGPTYTTIYPAAGASCDWTYVARGILSFSFELRDQGIFGFELPADQIIPSNLELLGALISLADSAWVRDPMRFRFPNELPTRMNAGEATNLTVELVSQTDSVAAGGAKLHYRMNPSDPFTEVVMTAIGGGLFEGEIPAADCESEPEYYFSALAVGGGQVLSPDDAPSSQTYSMSVVTGAEVAYEHLLSSNPGWTTQGQWAYGTPSGLGGANGDPDPTSGHTGSAVYGYNLSGDYPNNMSEQHLTTGPIDCSGKTGVRLSYWRWLGVETSAWDHAYIRMSTNGLTWTTVWENSSEIADSEWVNHVVELDGLADNQPTVYLRWTMGATDSAARYCGWNIDDVQLLSDVCSQWATPIAEAPAYPKSRFISFEVPASAGTATETALRVDLDSLHHVVPPYTAGLSTPFTAFEGEVRWVGPPVQYVESTSLGIPFRASKLQCEPHYQDWSTVGLLHVTGSAIVPSSSYRVSNLAASCQGSESNCTAVSSPLTITTARWADIVAPFNPPDGSVQPDAADISALVDKFKSAPGAPIKARTMLMVDDIFGEFDLTPDVGFQHISACVNAFRGLPYPLSIAECP